MGIQNMMKNKRGLQFKNAFYALIAVSMAIIAVGVIISGWNDYYNSGITYDLEDFNQLDEVSGTAGDYQDSLSPDNANPGTDFEATTFSGAFGIVNTFFASFRAVFGESGLLQSAGSKWFIPPYVIQGVVAMMIFAIAMGIVAIIFRLARTEA